MIEMRFSAWTAALMAMALCLPGIAWAALPQTLNYQGRLTLVASGAPVADSTGNTVVFSLWDDVSAGSQVWSETWAGTVATKSGLFNVVLGSINPLTIPFDKPYWLEIQVNADATPMTPRQPLTVAPYAFRARDVDAPLSLSHTAGESTLSLFNSSSSGRALYVQGSASAATPAAEIVNSAANRIALRATGGGSGGGIGVQGIGGVGLYGLNSGAGTDAIWGIASGPGSRGLVAQGDVAGVSATASAAGGAAVIANQGAGSLALRASGNSRFELGSVTFAAHVDFSGATVTGFVLPPVVPLSLTSTTSAIPALYAYNSALGTSVLISGTAGGSGTLAVKNNSSSGQAYAILSVTNGTGASRVGVLGASDPNFANAVGPTGVYGYSTLGTGIAGFVDGLSNSSAAIRGENIRAAGYGVVAFNSAPSGPAIALSATAVSSQGMAGYFQAVTGVVALGSVAGVAGAGFVGVQGFSNQVGGIGVVGLASLASGYGVQADNAGADASGSGGAALFVNGPLKTLSAIYVDTSATGTPSAFGTVTTPSGRIRFSVAKSLPAAGVYGPFPCSTAILNANSVVLVSFMTNVATVFSASVKVNTAGNAFTVNVASSGGVTFAGGDQLNFLIINQ